MKDNMVWKNRDKLIKGTGCCLHLFMPVLSFLLFEYVTGNLLQISRMHMVLSILWTAVFYLVVFGISGNTRLSVPIVSGVLFLCSLVETFVMDFRGNPVTIWDILALKTALTVAGNYVFTPSAAMILSGIILLGVNLLLFFLPFQVKGWKKRLGAAAGSFGLCAAYAVVFFLHIVPGRAMTINMWEMKRSYEEYGYILATAVSLQYAVKKAPQGYSHARMETLAQEIQEGTYFSENRAEEKAEDSGQQPVNIICIMNESLSDLRVAGEFTTNKDYFPYIHSLTENTMKGSLCVPVFGAMTSNSEFEFLTGDSVACLPAHSNAYRLYVKPEAKSLVSTLKDQGYRAVAMHPFPPENWNRDTCYANMGFDEFLSLDDFEGCALMRNYVSDSANYGKIIEQIEAKEHPEDRLFIFNVTMQNHGGYDHDESYPYEIHLTGEDQGKFPKADQYLSLMLESDRAFQELTDYFSRSDEPTMIVMFGDHQPSVEQEFFDTIVQRATWEVFNAGQLMWYQTPFLIWTNYSQPSQDMGRLGAVYLSSYLLERANLEMTPYQLFLLQMSKSLPIVHPTGWYGQDGTYYSWEEAEADSCPFQQLVLDYEGMVYNHSLDRQKTEALFSLP